MFAIGFTNSSRLLISLRTIRFADFGPKPGNLDINFINSSVMFQGSAPAGLPIALDGYVDSELATEVDDTITTEETP